MPLRRREKKLLKELREHAMNGVPYELTFKPTGKLTTAEKQTLEQDLRYHFHLWRATWILPWIDMIEKSLQLPASVSVREIKTNA